jgi:hypothetical protein
MRTGSWLWLRAWLVIGGASAVALTAVTSIAGQSAYTHGQNVAPAYEGWEQNADGSFALVFGYYNRNCREVLHIPIGPANSIEPGGPDRGQPTTFLQRRSKHVFRVRVPSDFGKKEVVWTLTAYGKTERAYGTLRPEYILDKRIIMMNESGYGQRTGEGDNHYPVVEIEGDAQRAVKVGQPLPLTAIATDDGLPHPRRDRRGPGGPALVGGWILYRGDLEHVTFDGEMVNPDFRARDAACPDWSPEPDLPELPAGGKFTATPTFKEPGTYVLRALARDRALKSGRDVTVTVTR